MNHNSSTYRGTRYLTFLGPEIPHLYDRGIYGTYIIKLLWRINAHQCIQRLITIHSSVVWVGPLTWFWTIEYSKGDESLWLYVYDYIIRDCNVWLERKLFLAGFEQRAILGRPREQRTLANSQQETEALNLSAYREVNSAHNQTSLKSEPSPINPQMTPQPWLICWL